MSATAPRRRTAAGRPWRLPAVLLVAAVLVGVGLGTTSSSPAPPPPAVPAVTVAAPVGSESSSWYCAGSTGSGGGAVADLYLVNDGRRPVSGTLTVVDNAGTTASRPITVPAGGQLTETPSDLVQGTWLASRVDLAGGGVSVSQVTSGPLGWSLSPCAATASANWYFASGSTSNGSLMYVALYNPDTTVAVVDLGFVTPTGETQPAPFEGLVVAPDQVVVAEVASYVQNESSVATMVDARSGRVVAEELQEYSVNGITGLSLQLGAPASEDRWFEARNVDQSGGETNLTVFNPSASSEPVTVRVRLSSGPVSPFSRVMAPLSTWTLDVSASIRIPQNVDYTAHVVAPGAGVVVGRALESGSLGASPQWGTAAAQPASVVTAASHVWVLPDPGVSSPVSGAARFALDLQNPSAGPVRVTVYSIEPGGREHRLTAVTIPADRFGVLTQPSLSAAAGHPLAVRASGALAVAEDATPAGMPGVVVMPGMPQA